ncbi:MAG TPA: mannosyltransferase family protein [Micromonosporaceae bacterium]
MPPPNPDLADTPEPPAGTGCRTSPGWSHPPVVRRLSTVRTVRWWVWSVGAPLGLFEVTRLVQLVMLSLLSGDRPADLVGWLLIWDANWFVRIAEDGYEPGYSYDPTGELTGNGLAFFPLYPILIRGLAWLPGISPTGAALAISWFAAGAAAVLLSLLGTRLYSRRTGYALAVLFGAQPMSVILSMGYTEALFCALVAAALLAVHREAWLLAGGLAGLAALTRPTGVALAGALLAASLWSLWRDPGLNPSWRMPVGVLTSLLAAPLYLLWVGVRAGDLDAWFRIQRVGWGTRWDFGTSTWRFLVEVFSRGEGWVQLSTAVIVVAGVVLTVAAVSERVWLPLSLYGVFAFAMAVGSSGYYHSRPRMLVPVLLLLFPLAIVLGRCRPRTAVLVLTGATLLGCWYGAYLVTVWPYTI